MCCLQNNAFCMGTIGFDVVVFSRLGGAIRCLVPLNGSTPVPGQRRSLASRKINYDVCCPERLRRRVPPGSAVTLIDFYSEHAITIIYVVYTIGCNNWYSLRCNKWFSFSTVSPC